MTGPSARIRIVLHSIRQRLRSLLNSGRLSVGAGVAAIGNSFGRAAGLMISAQKAHRLFSACEPRESTTLCIYRERNQSTVTGLVEQAQRRGIKIVLWALDNPLPELAAYTVGCGPGPRMDLFNRLWQTVESDGCYQLILADDDIYFTRGSLDQLLGAAIVCEFGIAQPAHDLTSKYSYPINRTRPFLLARHSTFVEPGPLVVVTQPWIDQVMPFPENFGMGWGIWLLWQKLQPGGCKLGIIDCVTVNHPSPVATEYTSALQVEHGRLRSLIREQGFQSTEDAQQILGTWKFWQPAPPWKSGSNG